MPHFFPAAPSEVVKRREAQLRPGVNVVICEIQPSVTSDPPCKGSRRDCLCSCIINVHYHYSECPLMLLLCRLTFCCASKRVSGQTASAPAAPVQVNTEPWHQWRQRERERASAAALNIAFLVKYLSSARLILVHTKGSAVARWWSARKKREVGRYLTTAEQLHLQNWRTLKEKPNRSPHCIKLSNLNYNEK